MIERFRRGERQYGEVQLRDGPPRYNALVASDPNRVHRGSCKSIADVRSGARGLLVYEGADRVRPHADFKATAPMHGCSSSLVRSRRGSPRPRYGSGFKGVDQALTSKG